MLVYGVVIGIFFLVAIILSIPKRQEDPRKESVERPRSDRSKSLPDRTSHSIVCSLRIFLVTIKRQIA